MRPGLSSQLRKDEQACSDGSQCNAIMHHVPTDEAEKGRSRYFARFHFYAVRHALCRRARGLHPVFVRFMPPLRAAVPAPRIGGGHG